MAKKLTNAQVERVVNQINTTGQKLAGTRWTKDELHEHLCAEYGIERTSDGLADVDESGCVNDYAFIIGIGEEFGYIDIYYLKVPYSEKDIYITEISACAE